MAKSKSPTARELDAQLRTLLAESDAARPRLRRLLLAGEDTSAVRAEIRALEERVHDIRRTGDQLAAQRELEAAEHVKQDAAAIAAEAIERLAALVASRQPPQRPRMEDYRS
jgi:hypothetical protein